MATGLVFMLLNNQIGTEQEYSINDQDFNPLPISDKLIQRIGGHLNQEVSFGDIRISKELQKHAIELIPASPGTVSMLEDSLYKGLKDLYRTLNYEYRFLGLGMHPLLKLDQTTYWDHDETKYYDAFDRLINIKQHGWLNIQALQINIPYENKENLVDMYNKLRSILPFLVAISASSPFVEGKLTPYVDNRLMYYRKNQHRIPIICNDILPEKIRSANDYVCINRKIYKELKECGAEILCREWVNSRGIIVGFTRKCLEVKAVDEQECIRSDMAISAFLLSLLRCELELEDDENALRSMLEAAIRQGTAKLKPELRNICRIAVKSATKEEQKYLSLIQKRIEKGNLAEIMAKRAREERTIKPLLFDLEDSLKSNKPYIK
ncbi:MAG: glutamate-cysteine ligase family protein [Methanotrichaceae archaeon]|nr:glutamate-cysteine ligase family protein [Methanotrichaceae archaeon]